MYDRYHMYIYIYMYIIYDVYSYILYYSIYIYTMYYIMIYDDHILDKDGGTYSHRDFVTLIGIKICFQL